MYVIEHTNAAIWIYKAGRENRSMFGNLYLNTVYCIRVDTYTQSVYIDR